MTEKIYAFTENKEERVYTLTKDVLPRIMKGSETEGEFIMQVLESRYTNTTHDLRINLSDGENSTSMVMLHRTVLNNLPGGVLPNKSIIKIKRYKIPFIERPGRVKYIMVIEDMELLVRGTIIYPKFGNPLPLALHLDPMNKNFTETYLTEDGTEEEEDYYSPECDCHYK